MNPIARMIYKANKALWRLSKPVTVGVRALLIRDNKVLLVKHTYHESWYLPGGRVEKGETYERAIRREAAEELGAEMKELYLHGIYNSFSEYKNDNIIIFVCKDFTLTGITDKEIESYDFFALDRLPENISPGTKKRLLEYINGKTANFGMW